MDEEYTKIIGSLSYKIQKFPGDIDAYEDIIGISKEDIINKFISGIIKIIYNYDNKKDRWFVELKAGKDNRFNINLESMKYEELFDLMNNEYKFLMSKIDINKILDIIFDDNGAIKQTYINTCDKEKIYLIFRKYHILRWSAYEVLTGYKNVDNKKFNLKDVLEQSGDINVECIAIINGYIQDVSNYFVMTYQDETGLYSFNLPQQTIENFEKYFINNLSSSISKLTITCIDEERDYFKAVKRMWSLARFIVLHFDKYIPAKHLIDKLKPFISGNVANLSQLKSRFKTMIKLLGIDSSENVINKIIEEVKLLKSEIVKVTILSNEIVDEIIDKLNNMVYNKTQLISNFTMIINIFNEIIQQSTINYLKKEKIFKKKYDNDYYEIYEKYYPTYSLVVLRSQ